MALRTPLTVSPYMYIGDSTGRPLDYGMVYFGEPNKDPEFYPIDIFSDEDMTKPLAQPIRTKGGFMYGNGDMVEAHAAEVQYSVKVLDQYGRKILYKGEMYRNNVSDFLADEIARATDAEAIIAADLLLEVERATLAETTETDRATAAEFELSEKYTDIATAVGSIGGGKKAYTTYALMIADKESIPPNSSIDVTNDTNALKNGSYAYDGTVFTKSAYDPLALAKAYADANPLFLPVRLTASDNLDDFLTPGEFYKLNSGKIDVDLNNYPAKLAGALRVSGEGGAIIQQYTVFSNSDIYTRRKTGAGFSAWARLATDISVSAMLDEYPSVLEWQTIAGASITYDSETRTVDIAGYVLAPLSGGTRRVRIKDISVVLPSDYSVCYLDLVALGSVKDITALNADEYIKVGDYNTGDPVAYTPALGRIPLFKYDLVAGKAVACAGFIPIRELGAVVISDNEASCYYSYDHPSLMLQVFSQVKGNLYVGFNVVYQQYLDDIIYEDYWRITSASFYEFGDGVMVANGKKALTIGESEFVIKQSAAKKDFTGGYHGDEQMTDVLFLANGVPVNLTANVPLTSCSHFEYIEKSTMHETTETTGEFIAGHPVIANHIKRTQFLNGGYKTYNKIIFNYVGTVQTVYHGISCISKDVASVVMTDKTFTPTAMTGSGSELMRETGARDYVGYNTENNLSVKATSRIIASNDDDLSSMSWVSDRASDSKYYRRSPVDLPVTVGSVMESEFVCLFGSK